MRFAVFPNKYIVQSTTFICLPISHTNSRPPGPSPYILSLVVISSFLFSGCAKNFVTKKRQVKFISQKTETEIGKKAKEEIVKEYGIYKDLDWQIYLDEVGQRVAKQSDRPDLQYDFTIVDSDVLNAFAVPRRICFCRARNSG